MRTDNAIRILFVQGINSQLCAPKSGLGVRYAGRRGMDSIDRVRPESPLDKRVPHL